MQPTSPNQALQRTTPGVTACAQSTQPTRHRPLDRNYRQTATPNRLRPHSLRRPPWSLSLRSLGVATIFPMKTLLTLTLYVCLTVSLLAQPPRMTKEEVSQL